MAAQIQYDLFKPIPSETEILKTSLSVMIDSCVESNHKVRKKLFAENGYLKKKMVDLEDRLQILERNICYGKEKESIEIA